MKNRCKYKNEVAVIQSEAIIESDTRKEYFKIKKSQLLTSKDERAIFDFIKKHASKNHVYKFVLHTDSGVTSKLIDLLDEKKKSSKKNRDLLKKCMFVCTYSNSDYVRVQNRDKKANFLFGLSPISDVLNTVPNGSSTSNNKQILLIVSDSNSPYFQQVRNAFEENASFEKVKVSALNKDKINDFYDNDGYLVVLSLNDTEEEYNAVGEVLNASKFDRQALIIECTQPQSNGVELIRKKMSDIQCASSGVCVNGVGFDALNPVLPYEKTSAIVTQLWGSWEDMKLAGAFIDLP